MGRLIGTRRTHHPVRIQAAGPAHIRSKPYLPVGDTTVACLTDGLSSPSGTSILPLFPTPQHELAMVWCLAILCVGADRGHNECVGQDQTQSVCVGIEPFARACRQQLVECAFTGPGPPSRPIAMASLMAQRLLPIVKSKSIQSIRYGKSIKSIESGMI